jgi:hypothetical protein
MSTLTVLRWGAWRRLLRVPVGRAATTGLRVARVERRGENKLARRAAQARSWSTQKWAAHMSRHSAKSVAFYWSRRRRRARARPARPLASTVSVAGSGTSSWEKVSDTRLSVAKESSSDPPATAMSFST